MKFELLVDQPSVELKKGICVTKETEITYKTDKVEQVIKDLKLEIIKDEEGSNGFNSWESKSYIKIDLNDGDFLLFDPDRGYYLPRYPVTTIEQAAEDLTSMIGTTLPEEEDETEEG